MNFQDLQTALAIPSDKVVKIAKGMLGADVDQLIDDVYAGKPITLTEAKSGAGDGQNQTVVVVGKATLLNAKKVTVTARVKLLTTNTVEAILTYDLPQAGVDSWKFSTSFPDMPGVIDWSTASNEPLAIPLDELDLSACTFVVSATATQDPATGVALEAGINFTATLTPSLVLVAIKELFGQSGRMTIFGTIRPDESGAVPAALDRGQYPWSDGVTAPGICLQADMTGGGANFDALKFDGVQFRIYSPITNGWAKANTSFAPILAYGGAMQVPSAGLTMQMTTPIAIGANDFTLTVDTKGFSLQNMAKLAGLADLAGTSDLVAELPSEVNRAGDALGHLQLMFAGISLKEEQGKFTISSVDMTIGMPDVNWDVLPGHFKVVDFRASFSVDDPFENTKRKFDTLVQGQIDIEGIPVQIRARKAADFTLYAELGESQTIPLKQLMQTYIPSVPPPSDLTIDALSLEVTPGKSYGMALAMAGQPNPWEIPIATKTLVVSDVSMGLNYARKAQGQGGDTTGSFTGTIALGDANLFVGYDIPGHLTLKADLPDIELRTLAREIGNITDLPVPPGFPDVVLTHSKVMFESQQENGKRIYDFALKTTVSVDGTEGLNLGAVVLKHGSTTGMAVAIWTPKWEDGGGWSPGSLWEPLSALEVTSAGLVLSSIKATQAQKAKIIPTSDVPAIASKKFEVVHGVTFFATLGLKTGQVAVLKEIFGEDTKFDLYASYDTTARKTALTAHLGGTASKRHFQFKGFDLSWNSTGTSEFTIGAKAMGALAIEGEKLDFSVEGKIKSSGAARLELAIEDWAEPFGYKRLTIRQFGVFIAMDGNVVLGLNGTFDFSTHDDTKFTFAVAGAIADFEAPSALAFELISNNDKLLTLGQVLEGITTIDIYDLPAGATVVPWIAQIKLLDLFLKFKELKFWAVAVDEVKINDVTYRKGFGFKGDITLFDKPITAYLDVKEAEKQFAGGAEMPQEVIIGSVLTLARPKTPEKTPELNLSSSGGVDGSGKGPIMAVSSQIDDDHNYYMYVAAHVGFLDVFTADIYGEVSNDGVKYYYKLAAGTSGQGAWAAQEVTLLVSREDLAVAGSLDYDFGMKDVSLGGFDLFGIIPIPEIHMPNIELGIGGNIGAGLSPPQFHIGGHVKFKFMGLDFHPEFHVDVKLDNAPAKLAEFGKLIWDWIKDNIQKLMEKMWDTAKEFADWVKGRWKDFKQFADQVAHILRDVFDVVSNEALKTLMQGIGFAAEVVEEAIKLLDEACSMTRAVLEL